jgi:hypothetical protein
MNVSFPDLSQLISFVAALDQHPIGAVMLILLVLAAGAIARMLMKK